MGICKWQHRMEMNDMKEFDCVEVIIEKDRYVREGVHIGMQGWICFDECSDGYWLVNIPQYGAKRDIATISVKEEDLKVIPQMDARINEQIKAQHEKSDETVKQFDENPDDLSGYLI